MARKSIYNYIFTPGATNVGTVIIPDPFKLGDILMITNVTKNTVIYNFGDPNRGGTVAYSNASNATALFPAGGGGVSAGQAIFANLNNGYTTLTLKYDTSTMAAGDVLQIYVESAELKVRPYDFGVDAVERMKIAAPQSLIDADFEYGMQPTKWVQFATMNDTPTVYEQPGTDIAASLPSYATFIGGGALASTWISSPAQTTFWTQNQGFDAPFTAASAGTNGQLAQGPQLGPRGFVGQYAMIIAQGQAGQPNCAAGTTFITNQLPIAPQYGGSYQRNFTVASTSSWSVGDVLCAVEMQGEGLQSLAAGVTLPTGSNVVATVITTPLTAGVATLLVNATPTVANSILFVETAQFGVWEAMQVVSGSGSNTLGVQRNLWGTNAANATIAVGARIRQMGNIVTTSGGFTSNANIEIMRVDSIDSSTQFSVTRSWFNTNASPTFGANSIVFKVNHTANPTLGAAALNTGNIEIVRAVTNVQTGQGGGNQIVERGKLGTTPLYNAGPGSLYVQLTGIFVAGNTSQPRVAMYAPGHGINTATNANVGTAYVSTVGISQAVTVSNVEGVFINSMTAAAVGTNSTGETLNNYLQFFPKTNPNQLPGYQLNVNDSQTIIRKGGIYTGANIIVANVTSNVGTPSLMTISTIYPHGILPGHIVQTQLINVNGIVDAGTGQFVVTSTPTPTSFTYIGKANLVANTTGIFNMTANVTVFPTGLVKHRFIDGGNNIGTNTPSHGYEMTRQTKKYFRYQSGKGIMFTSGTQFNPVFSPANIVANGTSIGSQITITTENEHGLQIGANVSMYGINTSGYSTYFPVSSVINNNQFTVLATQVLGSTTPSWAIAQNGVTKYQGLNYPRVVVTNWHGAKIRTGIFDDANGVFFEYDGATFWAVKRSSTNDLVGRVNAAANSNYVVGDINTRFLDQLVQGDQIVLRGMTHTITQIVDNSHMYVTPVYRGVTNAQDARYTKINEERTPQKAFNLDRADGTGPSGYVMNLTKMQMIGIQYTWYGAGFVDYMVRAIDGKMIMLHRSKGNNVNDEAFMRTGNLPARYQAVNKGARSWLSKAVVPSATEIQLYDTSEFPVASVTVPVTIQIDNEFVAYTKGPFAANGNIAGLTRGATLNSYILGAPRQLYAGSNAGTSWVDSGMPTSTAWAAQAYNPVTGTWVAIGGYGNASANSATSKDGQDWVAGGALPSSSTWVSLAYGRVFTGTAFRDYFVAISNTNGTTAAYSFDDGVTWTASALSASAQWSSVSFGYDNLGAPVFVAVAGLNAATSTTSYIKPTASSFGSWVAGGALPASQMWTSVAFGQTIATNATTAPGFQGRNNYFVAVGAGSSMTTASAAGAYSTDGGITWTALTVVSGTWASIAFGNNLWMAVAGGFVGTAGTSAQYVYGNPTGTWNATGVLPASNNWRSIAWGPIAQNGGSQGHWMTVAENGATTVAAYCTNSAALGTGVQPTWALATMPFTGTFSSIAWGQGFFHAVQSTLATAYQSAICTNGQTFIGTQLPTSPSNVPFGNLAIGGGNIVAIPYNGTLPAVSYTGGRNWQTGGALTATANWTGVAYAPQVGTAGQGRFVAIAAGATTSNFIDNANLGSTWTAGGALPSSAVWQSLCYVNGAFVAVANSASTSSTFSANAGASWAPAVALPTASNWSAVDGGYVPALAAVPSGNIIYSPSANVYAVVTVSSSAGAIAAYSNVVIPSMANAGISTGQPTLSVWGSATLPATANWTSVAYGLNNGVGYFVAVAGNSSSATAVSIDGGKTWTAGGALPAGLVAANANNRVVYGTNGVWIVVSNVPGVRSTAAAYSIDNGTTWVASTLPQSANWTGAVWSLSHNNFVVVSGDNTNISSNVALGFPSAGLAMPHNANTGVRVVSVTSSPDLNHWGSAVIMDGGFTVDRTYTFTYNVTNFAVAGVTTAQTMFMMRLAPSLSNALTGELGVKDLINRAQVLLQSMNINIAAAGSRFLLQGVLNPTNVVSANWKPLNASANFLQPSFTQFVANTYAAQPAAANGFGGITFVAGQAAAASGGEQLFSIPVSATNSGFLDLSTIKEITGMVLPGTGAYPNGNEILAINLVPVVPTASNVDIQITFIESQA